MSKHQKFSTIINPDFTVKHKSVKPIDYYVKGLQKGNRFVLSECITLIESHNHHKRDLALRILETLTSQDNPTIRIGITGSPGVGKSTFIESFGLYLIGLGHRPAILAIDPSSQTTKGSILGDKTRMQALSTNPSAFIRPSASGSVLGGTAATTKEAIILCEAAGYDTILIETVGVGQSEIEVDFITDINLLLLQPGSGDDIQGIKRGVVENADIFVINKADGEQLELAKQTKSFYRNAAQLFHHEISGWSSPILLASALNQSGLDRVYQSILELQALMKKLNFFEIKRDQQELRWFERQAGQYANRVIFENEIIKNAFKQLLQKIESKKITSFTAIYEMEKLLESIIKK